MSESGGAGPERRGADGMRERTERGRTGRERTA